MGYQLIGTNQTENFTNMRFPMTFIVIVAASTLPFLVYRKMHLLYFPYLIDLILGKKLNAQELEEKLKIEKVD